MISVIPSRVGVFLFLDRSMDNAFFSNRVNSWLKDREKITDFNIITMGSSRNKQILFKTYFGVRLLFLTIPKPLKQYTLF